MPLRYGQVAEWTMPPDFTYGSALQVFLAHHRLSLTVYAYEAESPFRPAYVSEFPLMIDFLPPHDPTASLVIT